MELYGTATYLFIVDFFTGNANFAFINLQTSIILIKARMIPAQPRMDINVCILYL